MPSVPGGILRAHLKILIILIHYFKLLITVWHWITYGVSQGSSANTKIRSTAMIFISLTNRLICFARLESHICAIRTGISACVGENLWIKICDHKNHKGFAQIIFNSELKKQTTVLYPLFCTFRNRKTYKIKGTLQNKRYVPLILYQIRGTLVCIQDLKCQKGVIV